MTADQELCLEVLNSQERVTSFPYYSTIRVKAVQAGAGPFTYTVPRGEEYRAFSYGVRKEMTSAGFTQTEGLATYAETNLQNNNETNNGQYVVIYGVAAVLEPGGIFQDAGDPDGAAIGKRFSDARLAAQLWTNCSVSINLNGDEQWYRLGKMANIQGHGGLMGQGYDSLATQAIEGGRLPFGFANNGRPVEHNFFRMPEGLVWKPKGNVDAELNILVRVERDIVLYSGGDEINTADDEAAAAGIRGYTYPDVVLAVITFYLKGWVLARRTNVS
jgi:hypothetical protein